MNRLYLPDATSGARVLEGAQFHKLVRVLRLVAGATVQVFDGKGARFTATLEAIDGERARLMLGAPTNEAAPRRLVVVQGLTRAERLELVLQKCTELGATDFVLLAAARSVVKLEGKVETKLLRWQRILEEAARQSGRADVPSLAGPVAAAAVASALPSGARVLVLDEEERALTLSAAVGPWLESEGPVALVVGPEGGLTREEVATLVAQGAQAVTLGRQVLRTETAALAALTVLRHLDGQFA
jgi:16S rRNA (uracil1498-N3)-methyltransferase